MTARKPPVPAELRELLNLLRDLTESLPYPATGPDGTTGGGWDARRDRQDSRESALRVALRGLADDLHIADEYPATGPDFLASVWQRRAGWVREELAQPLGYEPRSEKEAGQ